MTFHDLRMALTVRAAPSGRRTETTQDRLERRIVDGKQRAEEMTAALRGNDRVHLAENLYRRE